MAANALFSLGDLSIIFATFAGPIAAVQTQSFLERRRATHQRRTQIFRTLMASRATFLAPHHVEALNSIPIDFFGKSKGLRDIQEAWKSYLDVLSDKQMSPNVWPERRTDSFAILLKSISTFLGFRFTDVELKREVYFPRIHGDINEEQDIIRKGLAEIFRGKFAVPMNVIGFPVDPNFVDQQKAAFVSLKAWLDKQSGQQ